MLSSLLGREGGREGEEEVREEGEGKTDWIMSGMSVTAGAAEGAFASGKVGEEEIRRADEQGSEVAMSEVHAVMDMLQSIRGRNRVVRGRGRGAWRGKAAGELGGGEAVQDGEGYKEAGDGDVDWLDLLFCRLPGNPSEEKEEAAAAAAAGAQTAAAAAGAAVDAAAGAVEVIENPGAAMRGREGEEAGGRNGEGEGGSCGGGGEGKGPGKVEGHGGRRGKEIARMEIVLESSEGGEEGGGGGGEEVGEVGGKEVGKAEAEEAAVAASVEVDLEKIAVEVSPAGSNAADAVAAAAAAAEAVHGSVAAAASPVEVATQVRTSVEPPPDGSIEGEAASAGGRSVNDERSAADGIVKEALVVMPAAGDAAAGDTATAPAAAEDDGSRSLAKGDSHAAPAAACADMACTSVSAAGAPSEVEKEQGSENGGPAVTAGVVMGAEHTLERKHAAEREAREEEGAGVSGAAGGSGRGGEEEGEGEGERMTTLKDSVQKGPSQEGKEAEEIGPATQGVQKEPREGEVEGRGSAVEGQEEDSAHEHPLKRGGGESEGAFDWRVRVAAMAALFDPVGVDERGRGRGGVRRGWGGTWALPGAAEVGGAKKRGEREWEEEGMRGGDRGPLVGGRVTVEEENGRRSGSYSVSRGKRSRNGRIIVREG